MKKIGFYPGCSLTGSSREYNESLHAVAQKADIELTGIPDWNCCGATAAHNLNKELSVSLPARSLALAELNEMEELVENVGIATWVKFMYVKTDLYSAINN